MKILTIIGARPQFVKAAIVSRALCTRPEVTEVLLHTGQHYDKNMNEVFFAELDIPMPVYHLGVGSGRHGEQTGRMLAGIEDALLTERPDWVLVYGDTNSTLAGALAAAKIHLRVAHVEAGLRSFNRRMPEEVNRVLTDHAADLLFTPTQNATDNLRKEGIAPEKIRLVGDVMYDAALYYGARAERRSRILDKLDLRPGKYALATVHRAENTDDPARLEAIFTGLMNAADTLDIVVPLHPRTAAALRREQLLDEVTRKLRAIEPVGYLDMLMLEKNASVIATDSGGVQKEAFFYHVPCVTLRDETEWVELVELGWNRLASPARAEDVSAALLDATEQPPRTVESPYGSGTSAEQIANELLGAA